MQIIKLLEKAMLIGLFINFSIYCMDFLDPKRHEKEECLRIQLLRRLHKEKVVRQECPARDSFEMQRTCEQTQFKKTAALIKRDELERFRILGKVMDEFVRQIFEKNK